ncbi:MAG: UdgX family uracil-DNA binding protein [Pseudomonadota bacterium]
MPHVALPEIGTATAWRAHARGLLGDGIPPQDITWSLGEGPSDLFAGTAHTASKFGKLTVPKSFLSLAETVLWHSDPERFARLYALLWRVRKTPGLMSDRGDRALAKLWEMEKSVRRDKHKMRAFLRFREVGDPSSDRRRFAAWFEPQHRITEPNAEFFARRFGDMDWLIVTPTLTAQFEGGKVTFTAGQSKPNLPADGAEDLWITYFRNIFNPARLKVKAMTAEMPKKYWKNMPEAATIPDLIAGAEARVATMRKTAPSLPPLRAEKILARLPSEDVAPDTPESLQELSKAITGCRRCTLHCAATQPVMGEGPPDAALMIVGEQPGDREDLTGRPFTGPAGQLFDKIAKEAGLDRRSAFVTNAVKHFKFTPRGKRRIHQRPDAGEVEACKWWLDFERRLVRPKLILALGATATGALTGSNRNVTRRRGTIEHTADGTPVLITIHPSYLLRLPDASTRAKEEARFREDLSNAASFGGLQVA